jgi:Nickel responsive protein SCO4226-like
MKSGLNNVRRGLLKSGFGLVVAALLAALCMVAVSTSAYAEGPAKKHHGAKPVMHTYVIERTIPGAGSFSKEKLHDISAKSNGIIKDMGPDIQWVQSYVTGDKIYCIYRATDPELIREHAKKGGFPADSINEVDTMISPKTGR